MVLEDLPGTYSLTRSVLTTATSSTCWTPTHNAAWSMQHAARPCSTRPHFAGRWDCWPNCCRTGLPVCVDLTFTDDLARRRGSLDVKALSRAIGVPVIQMVAGHRDGGDTSPAMAELIVVGHAPDDPDRHRRGHRMGGLGALAAGRPRPCPISTTGARRHRRDMLHPVAGTVIFLLTMFVFFPTIFTVAAPLQKPGGEVLQLAG